MSRLMKILNAVSRASFDSLSLITNVLE